MRNGMEKCRFVFDGENSSAVSMSIVSATQRCFIFNQPVDAPTTTTAFDLPEELLKKLPEIRLNKNKDKTVQLPDSTCVWVDLQGATEEEHREAIQLLFPNVQQSQVDALLSPDTMYDVVELQPGKGEYIVGGIACSPNGPRTLSATQNYASEDRFGQDEAVLCLFVCNEQCLLTMHAVPFVGLAEVVRCVEVERGRAMDSVVPAGMFSPVASKAPTSLLPATTGAAILCTLVCFTCEAFLPDPTSLLSEVENIDEMVFFISPGQQDQADLLRRVALLRRRIANYRIGLYLKEKLLQELIVPSMRVSFAAKGSETVRAYKEILEKVRRVLERLDDTRDMLNQANLNFVTGVSMRMGQASAGLDFKLTILNQVASICLPMNLLISIFGMNIKIPFIGDQWDTLVPFYCVCGVLVAWAIVCLTPLFREALRGSNVKAITHSE